MKKQGVWMVVGLVLLGIVMRTPFTTIPAILSDIAKSFQVPVHSLGSLTSIPLIMFAIFSSLAPRWARKWGLERLMAGVLLVMSIGSILRIWNLPSLYLGTMIVGAAIACVNVLLPSIVASNFPHQVGLYTTLYTTVMGLSSTLVTAIASPVSDRFGWQSFVALLSAVILLAFLLWLPNIRERHGGVLERQASSQAGKNLWKNRYALALLLFGGLQSLLFYTELTWLPTMSQAAGLSGDQAGSLLGLYNLVSLPMSLVIPTLVTKLGRNQRVTLMVGFSGLTLLGLAILWLAPVTYWTWLMGHLALGLSVAALFPYMLVTFNLKTSQASETARLSGMVQTGGYLLAAIGPYLLGYSEQVFGSWNALLAVLALVTILMILCLLYMERADKIL